MSKRFSDTEKWKKPFIKSLPCKYKLFWFFILDDCDFSGIWQVDIEIAEIRIGEKINTEEAISLFSSQIVVFNSGEKWFIKSFINFQYGGMNEKNKLYNKIKSSLDKYNLMGHLSPIYGVKEKEEEKDNNTYSIDTIENNKNGVEVFSPLLDQFGFIDPKEAEMRYLNAEQYKSSLDEMAMIHHTSVSNVTAWVKKFTSKLIIEGWKNAMTEWIRYFSNWMNKNYSPGEINPSTISSETKAEKYQRLIRENKELLKNARPNS